MTQFIEAPEFGVEGGWRLLYRSRGGDGVARETRVLPVRGLGVLMSTSASRDGSLALANTATVTGVLVVEYLRPVAPDTAHVVHRELVTADEFNRRQGKKGGKAPPGVVVTYHVGAESHEDQEQVQSQVAGEQFHGQPGA